MSKFLALKLNPAWRCPIPKDNDQIFSGTPAGSKPRIFARHPIPWDWTFVNSAGTGLAIFRSPDINMFNQLFLRWMVHVDKLLFYISGTRGAKTRDGMDRGQTIPESGAVFLRVNGNAWVSDFRMTVNFGRFCSDCKVRSTKSFSSAFLADKD